MTELWDRQPGESSKRYFAFCKYRDMGPQERSLAKVAKEIAPVKTSSKLRVLQDWSSKDNWVERVTAWDEEQDRIKREYMEKALKAQSRKYLDMALTVQGKAVKSFQHHNPDLEPLKPLEAMRLLSEAVKLECLALGVPSDNIHIDHTGKVDVKKCLFLDEMEEEEAKHAAGAKDSQK